MAKNDKKSATPRLRFPEFRGTEAWEPKEIGEVFRITRGEVLAMTLVQERQTSEALYPVYSSQTKNGGLSGYYSDFLYEDAITWTTDGANAGDVNFRPSKFYCTNVCGVLLNTEGYANPCIAALINSVSRNYVSYVGNPKLMNGVMSKINIPFPSLTEQQKIADCLTSLDDIIAAQGRKVETLKAHKRGLMQKLFPREGATLPRLRFQKFTDNSSWHTQKISSILSKESEPIRVNPDETYREIGIRSHGKGIFHKEPISGKVIGTKRVFRVVENALIVNIVFAWEQAVATTSKSEVGMIASHRFPMYLARPNKCDVKYVKEFFLTKSGKHLLGLASPGGAGRNKTLGQKEFENLEISLPETVVEQTRIASCLSSLDALITAESKKFELLKTHKKGLMQQLFPVMDETS